MGFNVKDRDPESHNTEQNKTAQNKTAQNKTASAAKIYLVITNGDNDTSYVDHVSKWKKYT